jgi:hypothetical protein
MADEIDTRVTPSFHPETVQALDGYDDDTASILSGVEAAFNEAYVGIGRVHDAREAGKTNPAWTADNALIETQNFADKLTGNLTKKFDSVTASLTRVIEGLERDLSQPIEGRGVGAMSSEIRAHVKALDEGARMGFIQKAIEAGDERAVFKPICSMWVRKRSVSHIKIGCASPTSSAVTSTCSASTPSSTCSQPRGCMWKFRLPKPPDGRMTRRGHPCR